MLIAGALTGTDFTTRTQRTFEIQTLIFWPKRIANIVTGHVAMHTFHGR